MDKCKYQKVPSVDTAIEMETMVDDTKKPSMVIAAPKVEEVIVAGSYRYLCCIFKLLFSNICFTLYVVFVLSPLQYMQYFIENPHMIDRETQLAAELNDTRSDLLT